MHTPLRVQILSFLHTFLKCNCLRSPWPPMRSMHPMGNPGSATELAHKPNTHSVYDHAWNLFNCFLLLHTKDLNNLTEHDLVEFIVFLSLIPIVGSTFRTYVSGVHHHLKIHLLNDFQSTFLIPLVLRGTTYLECLQDVRIPITTAMLQKMCDAALHVTDSPYITSLMQAILTPGFVWENLPGHCMSYDSEMYQSPQQHLTSCYIQLSVKKLGFL